MENSKEIQKQISEYLDFLIKKIGLDLIYNFSFNEEKIIINFEGKDAKILTYKKFKILNDLQILLNIYLKTIKENVSIFLDSLNYKEERNTYIKNLAEKKARDVLITQKSYKFKPMNPYERRIIHMMFKDDEKLETISLGEEPNRCVIIKLKNSNDIYNLKEKNNFKKNGFSKKRSFGKTKRSLI